MATITLHGFPKPDPNAPPASYFCQKLECYLRLANFPRDSYTLSDALPFGQTKGKLPAITLAVPGKPDEQLVDSHFIIARLTRDGILRDVDAELCLTAAQRSETRAWQAWTEELVYPAIVSTRWMRPANYAALRASMPVPALLRGVAAWVFYNRVTASLYGQGVGRHSDAEVDTLLREWVDALDARLSDGRAWFHAGYEEPSTADAIVTSLLANAGGEVTNPEFNAMWMVSAHITAYAAQCTRRFFPEYKVLSERLEI